MDNNTLLFAYVYGVSDTQRVLIAKVLTERGWLFNKELKSWVLEKVWFIYYILYRMVNIVYMIIQNGQHE